MKKVKSIHFVGIKGAGMTPLAVMAKEAGFNVTGSDIADVFITDDVLKKGRISVFEGFNKSHVGDVDLVIATGAHGGFNNIEVIEAKRKNIKVITQGEAVGIFMKGEIFGKHFTGISICGTNGKTTTTSMVATVFKNASLSPSYIIGTSFIPSLGFAGHLGEGKYFIAEADEYATDPLLDKTPKFLWQNPKIIVITNIDFDHPDIYPSIKETKESFRKFILNLPPDGLLVAFGDDPNIRDVIICYNGKKIIYGEGIDNDYVISNIKTENRKTSFNLAAKDGFKGFFNLSIFGEQNVFNASASIIVGKYLGLSLAQLKKGISSYKGSRRRSEFIGKLSSGAMIFDDYAHNPTKIEATLKAFRSAYPNKRIVCIFQPHTYSRTKSLFEQFVESFNDADTVIITNIYESLREKPDLTVSSKDLVDKISLYKKNVLFIPNLTGVVEYIDKMNFRTDTIIITMGAGDIYKINEKLQLH